MTGFLVVARVTWCLSCLMFHSAIDAFLFSSFSWIFVCSQEYGFFGFFGNFVLLKN